MNSKKQTQNDACIKTGGKQNINKQRGFETRKSSILLDNTKQLREENMSKTEKEEKAAIVCTYIERGWGGGE